MSEKRVKFGRRLGNAIDGLIRPFFPHAAYHRQTVRNLEEATWPQTKYDGALVNWMTEWWRTGPESADDALLPELPTLRQRSRDLCRNNPLAIAIVRTQIRSVVGTGLRPLPAIDWRALGIDREAAKELQRVMRSNFRAHSKCLDYEDKLQFPQMQRLLYNQFLESGEYLAIRRYVDPRERRWARYGTCWQIVEPDCLATPPDRTGDRNVRAGIEFGRRGEPVAYFVSKYHPGDSQALMTLDSSQFNRIPAYDEQGRPLVLHKFLKIRPNQSRGVPILAAIVETLLGLKKGFNNEMVSLAVSACMAYVIEMQNPLNNTGPFDSVTDYNRAAQATAKFVGKMEPGTIMQAEPGTKVTSHIPNRPSSTFPEWLRFGMRWGGAASEVPLEKFMMDYSGTTYTSGRMSELTYWSAIDVAQQDFEMGFPDATWEMSVEEQMLRGYLPPLKNYARQKDAWTEATWIEPARPWVDPVKDATGKGLMLDRDMTTLAAECESLGLDYEEVLEQRHQERLLKLRYQAELQKEAEALGIVPDPEEQEKTPESQQKETQALALKLLLAEEEHGNGRTNGTAEKVLV